MTLSSIPQVKTRTGVTMERLLLISFCIWVASWACVEAIGLRVVIPWGLVLGIFVLAIPVAIVFDLLQNVTMRPFPLPAAISSATLFVHSAAT